MSVKDRIRQEIIKRSIHFSDESQQYSDFGFLFDLREILLEPELASLTADLAWSELSKYNPTVLYCLGNAGTIWGTHLQLAAYRAGVKVKLLIIREERKTNNRRRLIEGPRPDPGEIAFFVDDLINTTSTFHKCIERLKNEKINVNTIGVCAIVNFWFFRTRRLEVKGYKLISLFRRHDFGLTRQDPTIKFNQKLITRVLLWNDPKGHEITSPPILENDIVYMATNDHYVRAIDLKTKEILWQETAPRPGWQYIHKGIVNLMAIDSEFLYYTSYHGYVTKLEKKTGNVIWRVLGDRWIHSSPTLDSKNNRLYFATEFRNQQNQPGGDIVCLDADNGNLLWRFHTEDLAPCTPITDDINVYCGSNNKFAYCLDKHTGDLKWKYQMESPAKGRPGTVKDKAIFVTENGTAYVFDKHSGDLLFQRRVANSLRHIFINFYDSESFIIIDKMGYVKSFDSKLDLNWITRIRGPGSWYASVMQESCFILSHTGYFIELNIRDGSKIQFCNFNTQAGCPPVLNEQYLVLNFNQKGLYVFSRSNN